MSDISVSTLNELLLSDNDDKNSYSYTAKATGKITLVKKNAYDMFLNKSTLIYGKTGSGKSTVIYDIFHMLKEYISIPIIFIPKTSANNNDYSSTIISDKFYNFKPPSISILRDIVKKQEKNMIAYSYANDLKNLIQFNNDHRLVNLDELDKLRRDKDRDFPKLKEITKIKYEEKKHALIVASIMSNRRRLLSLPLSEDDKTMAMFAGTNPNIIIVIDDHNTAIKTLMSYTNNRSRTDANEIDPVNKILTEGRHLGITFLMITHKVIDIPPSVRGLFKNVIYSDTTDYSSGNKTTSKELDIVNTIFSEKIEFVTDINGKSVSLPDVVSIDKFLDECGGKYVKKELSILKIIVSDGGICVYKPTIRKPVKLGDRAIDKIFTINKQGNIVVS